MRVLVVGRGGREHALCEKIAVSQHVDEVYVAPGNPGMEGVATRLPYAEEDHRKLVEFAQTQGIDLVIIGPEKPLVEGLADRFVQAGIRVFAPSQRAAQIEGSKSFAKNLMMKYQIPTASYASFSELEPALDYIERSPIPIVIKADGLAGGKGVIVAQTKDEAREALCHMLRDRKYGQACSTVIIEEFLEGEEFSLMALVHEGLVVCLDIAQDHKRAYDGDQGPNTGGMGAYSPVPQIPHEAVNQAIKRILEPTAQALVLEGTPFTGVLYAGLMLTAEGPKVIEFNARFGDPETQVILPRLESDLVEVLLDVLEGRTPELKWTPQAMVGVVVASKGYPNGCTNGVVLPSYDAERGMHIYYSGVSRDDEGQLLSEGGRVYLAGSLGGSLEEAIDKVYDRLDKHQQPGLFYRRDIGRRAMQALR